MRSSGGVLGHFGTPTFTLLKRTLASALHPSASYRTMHIACAKCNTLLFRYKKKNGTKSKLVKMYTSRITFDPYDFVRQSSPTTTASDESHSTASLTSTTTYSKYRHRDGIDSIAIHDNDSDATASNSKQKELSCPQCHSVWGRPGTKVGHDIFKCIGGKIRMS